MWRRCAVVVVLFLLTGCASDGQKHWYDDAVKDFMGENQQMRGFGSRSTPSEADQ